MAKRSRNLAAGRCLQILLVGGAVLFSSALFSQTFVGAAVADEIPESFFTSAGTLKVETAVDGLNYPWSLVLLPCGEMLVSE